MSHNENQEASPELSGKTDEEIIALYQQGATEAFKALVERYTHPLYNFTARIGNRNNASDIVQETFIKVWKNLDRFNGRKASFKTWVFTIARNTATDHLRKKRSLLFSDIEKQGADSRDSLTDLSLENIPDDQVLPDAALQILEEKTSDKEFLDDLLKNISPAYREILVLHYQEELTFDEISKVLKKPLNTVKSGHRRALMELRKRIA